MSHSPLKMYTEFHKKHCLISGQGPIADIAKNLGFTKVTTIEQLCDAFPNLIWLIIKNDEDLYENDLYFI